MTSPRIVETPDGPALLIPTGGPAAVVASALGQYEELRPAGNGRDGVLRPLRLLLVEAERRRRSGEGFRSEPSSRVVVFSWLSAADVARRLGMTRQSVTRACRQGRFPGALHVASLGWLIPADVLPDLEDEDDESQQNDAA